MPSPFNILFLMTDQQAYEMLRCNGSSYVQTPCLDRLAESGCRFTHCYTTAPVCTPARAGLFTGMYPASAGAGMNLQPLFPGVQHLGQVFTTAGFTSAYIGKWHLDGMTGGYYGAGVCPDGFLDEGQVLQVGTYSISVIHTPGHSAGGVCLYAPGVLFTGDTLFAGSVGRTDFPGGSHELLVEGVRKKIFPLGDDLRIYPGHGPESTIGRERQTNPFFRLARYA